MSTIEIKTEAKEAVIDNHSPTSPSRKRRRKPAAGAQDDCFTCQESQASCDRRRPYCTPCLNLGKDCSGYKTTLTWGVGVASRGKLRGLSLPIASSKRAAQSIEEPSQKSEEQPPCKARKVSSSRNSSISSESSQAKSPPTPKTKTRQSSSASSTTYDFVNMDPSAGTTSATSQILPPPSLDWPRSQSMSHARAARLPNKNKRRHTLQPLQMPTSHPSRDYGIMPMTASIIGGYGHHDHGLSSQISPMIPTFTGYGLISPSYGQFQQPDLPVSPVDSSFYPSPENLTWDSSDDLSSALTSEHGSNGYPADPSFLNGADVYGTSMFTGIGAQDTSSLLIDSKLGDFGACAQVQLCPDDVGDHSMMSIPRSLPSLSIGRTSNLQFLIDYYNKVISPVIVAFDGPNNPYRAHILSLAAESETLQHAIAALSAGNIRIRKIHNPKATNRSIRGNADSSHDQSVRRSSYAYSLMDARVDKLPQISSNEPSADELYHKTSAVKSLNQQLADPNRRGDDSILATLLILCLYHICDTGIAKFKTQFAGVKKILALRGGTRGRNSKASNWLTIMFTWFDAMTATVNEREGQLSGDDLETSNIAADEWALENLAGCDGRLFRIIAKLGRLNMLSQNKPVSEPSPRSSPKASTPPPGSGNDYYSMTRNRLDGNGWGVLPDVDSDAYEADDRSQFWREWTDTRRRLHEWELDDSVRSTPVESTSPESDRLDIYHISESFRYSALLYTERLAYPHLSSSHPKFQNLVTQALFHITNVKSDVFLLWPLFITGTECVSETGRHMIRERCLDIQKDSGFFNNISGLELLERIWRDDCGDAVPTPLSMDSMPQQQQPVTGLAPGDYSTMAAGTGGGFKWTRAMQKVDGEYIVV